MREKHSHMERKYLQFELRKSHEKMTEHKKLLFVLLSFHKVIKSYLFLSGK